MTPPVVGQDPQHEGCKAPYCTDIAHHDDAAGAADATHFRGD
jgi:hypothetical protein